VALVVTAPLAGAALMLRDVPDPVFAAGLVGPGLAIDPHQDATIAVAPMAGRLVKLMPHAFVVIDGIGRAVLVHLGIDTVSLSGDGFVVLASEGQHVAAGDPVVRWDPLSVAQRGLSPICPVVALDAPVEVIGDPVSGPVALGGALFTWRDTRPRARSSGGASRHRRGL
jgi:glucose-specific phosphotransferase system IIA component